MLLTTGIALVLANDSGLGGTGMHFITWIILGLVAGFIASKIVNKTGEGLIRDILLGIIGAIAGGYVTKNLLKIGEGVTGLNITSLLIAVGGAVLLLVIYHAIRRVV
jgi:uncharacterized membrane protein YeaQ/YmgE (transglycosylase-associated protein family)